MIELVSAGRCIGCDKCVAVCPTDVFDRGDPATGGVPVVARQDDCQTCFLCEAYCPVDALFVAPQRAPLPDGVDEEQLAAAGHLGGYRDALGWGRGRTPGAASAIGPPSRNEPGDPPGPPLV